MFPPEFVQRIRHQFSNPEELLTALQQPAPTSVRLHPVKGHTIELPLGEKVPWCDEGYYLTERPVFTLDPAFHSGAYYVQESSSMFIQHILNQLFEDKNIYVLDACAAPGGKSTLIASWLNGKGLLVSNEIIRSRASVLLENSTKWGYPNTWVTNADPFILGGLYELFDCILVDAPCSGEGLFRKDQGALKEWSEANCELCASRQKKIVADILPALQEGGYLIYSTCTYNPAENDENLQWIMSEFPMELVSVQTNSFPEVDPTNGGYAFYPHKTRGEGFYCCVLQKTANVQKNAGIREFKFSFTKPGAVELKNWLASVNDFFIGGVNNTIVAIPDGLENMFEKISAITKITGGYLALGELKGKDMIPVHSLAMSIHINDHFPALQLDREKALLYLSRKDFSSEISQTGWHMVTYNSHSLGWAKVLSNRINNYYPTEWRIRMAL